MSLRPLFSRALALVALAVLASATVAADAPSGDVQPIPPLKRRVTDVAGMLSSGEQDQLEQKLATWEGRTGTQLAVLIVPTTQPEAIEQYSIRVAEAWKIGKKGQDNGLLLLIAKNDKKIRIDVGYGLEGNIPDVIAKRIIAEVMTPLFKAGNFYAGIDAAIDKLEGLATGTEAMPAPAKKQSGSSHSYSHWDWGSIIPFALFGLIAFGGLLRRIFGTFFGGVVGGGAAAAVGTLVAGSLVIGLGIGVVVAIVLMLTMGLGGSLGRGVWLPGGGGGWSGGSGGGSSWSGGGGGFGGGGASGSWE